MGLSEFARAAMDQTGPIAGRPRGGSRDILIDPVHRAWVISEAHKQGLRVYKDNRWHATLRDDLAQGFQVYTRVLPTSDVYLGVAQAMLGFEIEVRSGRYPALAAEAPDLLVSTQIADRQLSDFVRDALRSDCQWRVMGRGEDYGTSITAASSVDDTLARLLMDRVEVDLSYHRLGEALGTLTRTAAASFDLIDTARALESVKAPPRVTVAGSDRYRPASRSI